MLHLVNQRVLAFREILRISNDNKDKVVKLKSSMLLLRPATQRLPLGFYVLSACYSVCVCNIASVHSVIFNRNQWMDGGCVFYGKIGG